LTAKCAVGTVLTARCIRRKKMVKDHSSIPLINGPPVAVRLG
jgi:hypothetical protein